LKYAAYRLFTLNNGLCLRTSPTSFHIPKPKILMANMQMPYTASMRKMKSEKNIATARLMPVPSGNSSKNTKPDDARKGVQSVEQAFDILRVFEKSDRALAIKDIADALDMQASKIHHYLAVRCIAANRYRHV